MSVDELDIGRVTEEGREGDTYICVTPFFSTSTVQFLSEVETLFTILIATTYIAIGVGDEEFDRGSSVVGRCGEDYKRSRGYRVR